MSRFLVWFGGEMEDGVFGDGCEGVSGRFVDEIVVLGK